ncbi:hypothetical protein D9611_013957 [Ephemerocybe angulata]|uniref:T6SS Phospholipase effector Tle1-like catalytic domain-containing protein n=1 Tax=Ephemerocybe angulata TaxID=980116 RepID=A0A8H5ARI0_9AGAR|nr:hypothetical protein D9611_013957 [Tulosesus angulatus]
MSTPTKDTQHRPSVSFDQSVDGLPKTSQSPPPIKTTFSEGREASPLRQSTLSTYQGSFVIPTVHKSRTLVLCFDGTGDQFDADNSNIVGLFSMLAKGDPDNQMVYYQAGIGTYIGPRANPFLNRVSKILDEAIAWNLDTHIMDGYEFLMQNYRANDRICIFGFSRGAYTARCLAGMLHKVGLLPACNHQQVPFAYKMYKRPDEVGWKQSNAFKKAFSIDVDIEFLGVWDTVNSVGIIPRRLPFSTSNNIVRNFRHAIALDERRAKFKANMWNRPVHGEHLLSITDQKAEKRAQKAAKAAEKSGKTKSPTNGKKKEDEHLHHFEDRYSSFRDTPTNVEEVWFAGCHCDVGGGSVTNETRHSLARITLRWMIREIFKREVGIIFQVEGLRALGMDPGSLYPVVLPRAAIIPPEPQNYIERVPKVQPNILEHSLDDTSSEDDPYFKMTEEEHELLDALSPKYDQLALKKTWWFGEIVPMTHRYQRSSNNEWEKTFKWNMGMGRVIPRQKIDGAKLHRSVKIRMESAFENGKKYVPKAVNLDMSKVVWVD